MNRWIITYEGLEPFTIPAADLDTATREVLLAAHYTDHKALSIVLTEPASLTSGLEKLTALGVLTDEEAQAIADAQSQAIESP